MKAKEETRLFIEKIFLDKAYGNVEDVFEDIYRIGAYYGAFDEENYGPDCRRNTVYGFLETLEALLK